MLQKEDALDIAEQENGRTSRHYLQTDSVSASEIPNQIGICSDCALYICLEFSHVACRRSLEDSIGEDIEEVT